MTNLEEKSASNEKNAALKITPKPVSVKAEPSSKFVKLPNGTRLRPFLMASCSPASTGVSVLNSAGNIVGFVDAEDPEEKQMVMDLLDKCISAGKRFVQPDWSFMITPAR